MLPLLQELPLSKVGERKAGFVTEPRGTHIGRTMMLADLRRLMASCALDATYNDYQRAIVQENVLLKRTESTRRTSLRFLTELYALDARVLLFRALRDLWKDDADAQPLLAFLCAVARDPILRVTADLILNLDKGAVVTPEMISQTVKGKIGKTYSAKAFATVGRNVASSWQQAGHLTGHKTKLRAQAHSTPANVAYALFLGYLSEARGQALFHTLWARLLDTPQAIMQERAVVASQRGWIDYRHAGNVIDIGFGYLLRKTEAL